MAARTPLVAGNWKMHGTSRSVDELLERLVNDIDKDSDVEVAVFPPFVYLNQVAARVGDLADHGFVFGAQTLSEHDAGAYTGEVSGAMLADLGCRYVLVGHSERRALYHEADAEIAAKFQAAQRHDLIPVLCVGETLDEREAGKTEVVIARQVEAVLDAAGIKAFSHAVIAYEPVWAIGTGKTASPEQAQPVHAFVRETLSKSDATIAGQIRIVYGGSVKAANAADLFSMQDIDGGLVGGASLHAEDFLKIIQAAD